MVMECNVVTTDGQLPSAEIGQHTMTLEPRQHGAGPRIYTGPAEPVEP